MKALEIEAIVQKKGNKILIELPESAEYLVNQKVKLALIDKRKSKNVQAIFDLVTAKTDELPEDYSVNFEHYLYGKIKREDERTKHIKCSNR